MTKSYQYVSKCSCCDDLFTRVSVPFIHVVHCSKLGEIARKAMIKDGFKGSLSLQCAGDTITNFYYQYEGNRDLAKSEYLYERLSELAKEYVNALPTDDIDWSYHPIAL